MCAFTLPKISRQISHNIFIFLVGLIKIFQPNLEDNISTGNLYKLISTNTNVNKKTQLI